MDPVLNIETISHYNELKGIETRHPLITVFGGMDEPSKALPNGTLYFGLYGIFIKGDANCELLYGRNTYDFKNGTMVFISPGQVIKVENSGNYSPSGHFLVFNPEFIRGTALAKQMSSYSFFSYEMNESLHLSDKERQLIIDLYDRIDMELDQPIDKHSQTIISNTIESILNYCTRYYDRQFITRRQINTGVIEKFDKLLSTFFHSETPKSSGLPSVAYFADQLHLSPNYLGDLIKKETGKSAMEHIHLALINVAKEKIYNPEKSINEVALELGFKYPQHFSRMFKKETGMTPSEYRALN